MTTNNYAPFGVGKITGGHVTIVNNGPVPARVGSHTGGTVTIIENGKMTTVVKPKQSGTRGAQGPAHGPKDPDFDASGDPFDFWFDRHHHEKESKGHQTVVNIAPGGIEEVKNGETVVLNNR